MAEAAAEVTAAGIPRAKSFSGNQEDWPPWKNHFVSLLGCLGMRSTTKVEFQNKMPDSEDAYELLDEANADHKQAIIAYRKNTRAAALLQSCMEEKKCLQLVMSALDEDEDTYPGGLMHKAWSALLKRFEPDDLFAEQQLDTKLENIKLGEFEDQMNIKLEIEDALRQ